MTQDGARPLPTLGERLDARARRHAARLLAPLPWAGPARVLIDHVTQLGSETDRFDRIESAPERPAPLTEAAVAGRPRQRDGGGRTRPPDPSEASPEPSEASPDPAGSPPTARSAPRDEETGGVPRGTGDDLPTEARSRLRAAVGPAADAMRVHHDAPADALARARRADAVTVGRDVHFRHGRLRPQDERGFGLLVHEATHVMALLRPGASWRRATGAGLRAEEAEALANERTARSAGLPGRNPSRRPSPWADRAAVGAGPPGTPAPGLAAARPAPVPNGPATPALRAPTDRDTSPADAPPPETTPGPPLDVRALRRDVVDELMRQLRSEFERGG
ncbi:DUF4157 domain-containing protein [Streptomyces sp. NPDC014864]|uniref:eCIS core domain-containing protein n=1 Tax=Streptomyces sp. NPDC014864 TaxID=3364924 RepID=UPI00370084E0